MDLRVFHTATGGTDMQIRINQARQQLAKAGITLGTAQPQPESPDTLHFEALTPLGTRMLLAGRDIVALLKDLGMIEPAKRQHAIENRSGMSRTR